ncbi:hypothetical protein Tsubulata_013214 [Turnera subulata]|uniref:Uncharacterized protein n=1 Tax=Turnera subulata TaxID=218843 RepID=A0A9Q0FKN1_9ROSI|nr:hypothetical protein Tsubulata_013214 [Turnera subulata]
MAKVVMVFDFDKTIIDCDSDNWVVEHLGVNEVFSQLLPTLSWNHLMDRMMMELHSRGKTTQDIADCLKQIPLHPRIISAIKSAHASGYHPYCYVNFVPLISVLTVTIWLKPERCDLRIGLVMESIRKSIPGDADKLFIYVGDGTPDFCAALQLGGTDILMPRKNFPFWELICNNPMLIKANIQEWNDGMELGTILLNVSNTMITDQNSNERPDALIPVDCKSQTASISGPDVYNRNVLPVPQ